MAMTNACEHGPASSEAALVAVASMAAVPLCVMSRDRSAAAA
jgi:hypothetical protein